MYICVYIYIHTYITMFLFQVHRVVGILTRTDFSRLSAASAPYNNKHIYIYIYICVYIYIYLYTHYISLSLYIYIYI